MSKDVETMDLKEAQEWMEGKRSMTNIVPVEPIETRQERIAGADAAKTEQAYWILRFHGVLLEAEAEIVRQRDSILNIAGALEDALKRNKELEAKVKALEAKLDYWSIPHRGQK